MLFLAIVLITGAVFLYNIIWYCFLDWIHENPRGKAILVTGCDSGFGFELALRAVLDGINVFATCLTEEGQTKLQEDYKELIDDAYNNKDKETIGKLWTLRMDVKSQESIEKALDFVVDKLGPEKGLFALINNAGIVGNGVAWDDWITPEDYEETWRVNTLGVIRVTQCFKRLVKAERGRIITTASICGRIGLPGIGPYTVSKYAVEGYCDSLRAEMMLFDVKVIIIEPGFFRTNLTNAERNTKMVEEVWAKAGEEVKADYGPELFEHTLNNVSRGLSIASSHTEWVVDAYLHAIKAKWPHPRYQVGYDSRLIFIPLSMMPTRVQDIIFWILMRGVKHPVPQRKGKELLKTASVHYH